MYINEIVIIKTWKLHISQERRKEQNKKQIKELE